MTRMASILEKQRLQTLEAIETDAADSLSNSILTGAWELAPGGTGADLDSQMRSLAPRTGRNWALR